MMLEPIVKAIEVPCGQAHAFRVFIDEMPSWWPLDKRSMSLYSGNPAKTLRVEARKGGEIIETAYDGTQHLWGTITAYDPHDFVSMRFHMGLPPEKAGLVEVRFVALGADRTLVELTQSDWEAFGDMAEMMRGGYGSSWDLILEPYVSFCSPSS